MPYFKPNKEEQDQVAGKGSSWEDRPYFLRSPKNAETYMREKIDRADAAGLKDTSVSGVSEFNIRSAESHIKAINEGRIGVPDNYKKKEK